MCPEIYYLFIWIWISKILFIYLLVVKKLFSIAIFLQENAVTNYNHFSNSFLCICPPWRRWLEIGQHLTLWLSLLDIVHEYFGKHGSYNRTGFALSTYLKFVDILKVLKIFFDVPWFALVVCAGLVSRPFFLMSCLPNHFSAEQFASIL